MCIQKNDYNVQFTDQYKENDIILYFIKKCFNINNVYQHFLEKLELEWVNPFISSIVYFMDDDQINDKIDSKVIKQMNYIRQLISLFWKNDELLSTQTIRVLADKTKFPKEQKLFFDKNKKELQITFDSLKRKTAPNNSFKLVDWLGNMLDEFFGGFVSLNISDRKHKMVCGERFQYYNISINCTDYIELMLNGYKNVVDKKKLDKIDKNYGNMECSYKCMHNCEHISDLINKNIKGEYVKNLNIINFLHNYLPI